MIDVFASPEAWLALLTLTVMEIILGIDNIIFISVLVSRLPAAMAKRARQIGLGLALVFRLILLMLLAWLIGLTEPVFTVLDHPVSWRDIILFAGGAFLLVKATVEIHKGIEGEEEHHDASAAKQAFSAAVAQIILIDLVFSIDSIVTAIGMANDVEVMVIAVIIAMIVMYVASGPISHFISQHPTTKMLALAFLLLIGVALVADGVGFHIPRAYIYFAMAFSAGVEFINIMAKSRKANTKALP